MLAIGKFNHLSVLSQDEHQVLLDGGDNHSIPLPLKELDSAVSVGQQVNVFVYSGKGNSLMATCKKPLAMVDDIAWLKVVSTQAGLGAFLNWGLPKDLLLPLSEQSEKVVSGQFCLVKLFLDEQNRIAASMLLDDFVQDEAFYLKAGQAVDLIIAGETELGYKAIVNQQFWGVLYKNETFQPLKPGHKLSGFIKKIREDSKIDLSLNQDKYRDRVDGLAADIINKLEKGQGFMAITDKSPPELIYQNFKVSKKVFKQAIGQLYKKRLIRIEKDGVHLNK